MIQRRFVVAGAVRARTFSVSAPRRDDRSYKLLVVGGGTGGCSIASKFASKLGKGKVAVLEPSEVRLSSAVQFPVISPNILQFFTKLRITDTSTPQML